MTTGRPKLLSEEVESQFRKAVGIRPDASSRTIQNTFYAGRALSRLCGGVTVKPDIGSRWSWLLRPDGGTPHPRTSIMHQLGRTQCGIALETFADEVCRLAPTASEAVANLRLWQRRYADMILAEHLDGATLTSNLRKRVASRAIRRKL